MSVKGKAAVQFSGLVNSEVIVGFDNIDEEMYGIRFEKYFTPKSLTQKANVVYFVRWRQRPGVTGMGSYPEGANFWTSWLRARTPASLGPYIPRRISRRNHCRQWEC